MKKNGINEWEKECKCKFNKIKEGKIETASFIVCKPFLKQGTNWSFTPVPEILCSVSNLCLKPVSSIFKFFNFFKNNDLFQNN